MSKVLLIFSFCLFLSNSFSQTSRKRFYTKEGEETDSLNSFYFERSIETDNGQYKSESYYTSSGKIRHKEDETSERGFFLRTYYFHSGIVKGEGSFYFTTPDGLFNSYYSNGKRHAELLFENDRENSMENTKKVGIINYWDSLGNRIINEGQGFCNCLLEPHKDIAIWESGKVENGVKVGSWRGADKINDIFFDELYDNGKLIRGKQIKKGITYSYDKIEQPPVPSGGMVGFYKYIKEALKYPAASRRNGIEGRVFVQFLIDKTGNITECKVVRGISPDCDSEALRVIQSAPKWISATYRGKAIEQLMVLPITFKLN